MCFAFARHGERAFAVADDEPDTGLLLLDINMLAMNGLTTLFSYRTGSVRPVPELVIRKCRQGGSSVSRATSRALRLISGSLLKCSPSRNSRSKRKKPSERLRAPAAFWIRLNAVLPSERTPYSSPSRYAVAAGSSAKASAMAGYFVVQSRPVGAR